MKPKVPPSLPWMEWSSGDRVVVRYRAEDGVHDALGTLLEVQPSYVVVEAKRGRVRVDATAMITGKKVPPAPVWPPA